MTTTETAAARRVHELRAFASNTEVVPILVQNDPDPDGMASALGIRTLLHRAEDEAPVISLGEVTRPENQRLAELLNLPVVRVSESELNGFRRVIAVDTQPAPVASKTRYAVIDHHPVRSGYSADFVDIRPEIGAAATMITQYLRVADEARITPRLATALIYGIRTDTEVLRRGTAADDIEAYAFLQALADQGLLRKIGRAAFSAEAVRALGTGLAGLAIDGEVAVAYVGALDRRAANVLPSLADFCLGIEGISWSAAAGVVDGELVVNIRRAGSTLAAGDLAKAMADEQGMGGGHQSMARVAIRGADALPLGSVPGDQRAVDWVLDRVRTGISRIRNVRSDGASAGSSG
jgi:nanoRNase/pAp phosphatase (c-di-AMP/oligoRNAs hydrolase)